MDHKLNVAVIGGGWAGLAAAVTLSHRGIPVTLHEAAPHLGGRARAIAWQGHPLDNGQHILLGAYHETLRLMAMVGMDPEQALLRLPLRLVMQGELDLRTPPLPAPLHLLTGLLSAHGLGFEEKLAAVRLMTRLRRMRFKLEQDLPLADFLAGQRQPQRLTRLLWEPLCLAALNTPLPSASTQVFLNVLRDSFSRARSDSDLLLPRHDLDALFPRHAGQYLQRHGAAILTASPVQGIRRDGTGYIVRSNMGETSHSHVICAVSPWRLASITPELVELEPTLQTVAAFDYQPICTVYLQYPENARLPFPMLGLSGGLAQWVLDRGTLLGQHGLMAVVISAEGPHQLLSQEELAAAVAGELQTQLPELGMPGWHKVITEKRATFACQPGLQRPAQSTALNGLYLAGDYTAGDYPATIEAAVRSGVKCADSILERLPA